MPKYHIPDPIRKAAHEWIHVFMDSPIVKEVWSTCIDILRLAHIHLQVTSYHNAIVQLDDPAINDEQEVVRLKALTK